MPHKKFKIICLSDVDRKEAMRIEKVQCYSVRHTQGRSEEEDTQCVIVYSIERSMTTDPARRIASDQGLLLRHSPSELRRALR